MTIQARSSKVFGFTLVVILLYWIGDPSPGNGGSLRAGLALAGFVGFLVLLVRRQGQAESGVDLGLLVPILGLALLKLWLTDAQTLTPRAGATHDDRLFLRLAQFLQEGQWLGPYDSLTLVKGPGYPLWIALSSMLEVRLLLAQHLLYVAACATLTIALRPLLPRRAFLLTIYAVLLFNPMTYTNAVLRVVREGIYASETLLVVACLAGIYTHRNRGLSALARWSAGLGVSLSAFWLTREEAIWIMPSAALLLGTSMLRIVLERQAHSPYRVGLCVLPFVILGCALAGVSLLNRAHYGALTTCEFRWNKLHAAYGALTRVTHDRWHPKIPLPAQTRRSIYAVSPAFEELAPHLEGEPGRYWASASSKFLPQAQGEISGGWFIWAFRDAVARAGYDRDAKTAGDYYTRLAAEVNRACEEGRLPAGPRRATLRPPWRGELGPLVWRASLTAARFLTEFDGFQEAARRRVRPPASSSSSTGRESRREIFRLMTHERLTPLSQRDWKPPSKAQSMKLAVLRYLGFLHQAAGPWLALLALAVFLVATTTSAVRRAVCPLQVLAAGLLLAIATRIGLLALLEVTSFSAFGPLYLTPAYPLLLLFITVELGQLARGMSAMMKSTP